MDMEDDDDDDDAVSNENEEDSETSGHRKWNKCTKKCTNLKEKKWTRPSAKTMYFWCQGRYFGNWKVHENPERSGSKVVMETASSVQVVAENLSFKDE